MSRMWAEGKLTDIAPDGRNVIDIPIPHYAVDEQYEALRGGPHHEGACSGIPCLKVPGKRNQNHYEAEEGE